MTSEQSLATIEPGIEGKVLDQDRMKYLSFLNDNIPDDFHAKKNTGRYVEGDPGAFYLTVERNGYLGNNQKRGLNDLISEANEENIAAVMERAEFKPIEKVNGQFDGQGRHAVMGIAGPTAKKYGMDISLYLMSLDSTGPGGKR